MMRGRLVEVEVTTDSGERVVLVLLVRWGRVRAVTSMRGATHVLVTPC